MTRNQIDYVFNTFRAVYDVSDADITISYGKLEDTDANIVILESSSATTNNESGTLEILKTPAVKKWKDTDIPFLFNDNTEKEIIDTRGNRIVINYDLIAAGFYLLSGYQEYISSEKDQYSRYKYSESIQSELNISKLPIVNYYFDIICHAIKVLTEKEVLLREQFRDNPLAFISHDIDTCRTGYIQDGAYLIRSLKIFPLLKLLTSRIFHNDLWFNFDYIKALENNLSLKSTFFFLTDHRKYKGIKGADYKIISPKILKVINDLAEDNFEIGMHAPPKAIYEESLHREINKIPLSIKGNRTHFLAFSFDKTIRSLEYSGILYDSTLGFPDISGFRNSFCHPFFLFDHENDRTSKILEIPLVVMDATYHNYQQTGDLNTEPGNNIKPLIDEVSKFNGVFTLLWHNNYFTDIKFQGYSDLYIRIIKLLKKYGFSFKTGSEICTEFIN